MTAAFGHSLLGDIAWGILVILAGAAVTVLIYVRHPHDHHDDDTDHHAR